MIQLRYAVIGLFLISLSGQGIAAEEPFRWSRDIGARPIHTALSLDQERLLVSTGYPEGNAYVLSTMGKTIRTKSVRGGYAGDFTVSTSGNIYYTKNTNAGIEWTVFGWRPDLSERWKFRDHTVFKNGVALSADQHLYIGGENGKFYSINDNGSLRWSLQWTHPLNGAPVIGSNGLVYQTSYGGQLRAVHPNGTLKWSVSPDGSRISNLSIGSDGVIYLGTADGGLYAISPGGSVVWSHDSGSSALRTDPVIGERGQIYFTTADNRLISMSSSGEKLWDRQLPGRPSEYLIRATPVVDRDGRIYVGNFRDNQDGYFCIVTSSGDLIRKRHLAGIRGNMLLSPSGDLFFVTGQRIHAVETSSDSDVRYSPWPMYQHDHRRTGRATEAELRRGSPIKSALESSTSGAIEGSIHLQNRRIVPNRDVIAVHLKSLEGASLHEVDPSTVTLAGMKPENYWMRDEIIVFVLGGPGRNQSFLENPGSGPGWHSEKITLEGQLKNGRHFQASSRIELWTGSE